MRVNKLLFVLGLLFSQAIFANDRQESELDLVDLREFDSSILVDMRLAGNNNYIGHPVKGYKKNQCLLNRQTAEQLAAVQQDLLKVGFSLKIYDCHRNKDAADAIAAWSQSNDDRNQALFYPSLNKNDLVELQYIKLYSQHRQGKAVDVTIVTKKSQQTQQNQVASIQRGCFDYKNKRYYENSVNMGTNYNCFHPSSHTHAKNISLAAFENRLILRLLMEKHQFSASDNEWWHFEAIA